MDEPRFKKGDIVRLIHNPSYHFYVVQMNSNSAVYVIDMEGTGKNVLAEVLEKVNTQNGRKN